MQLARCIELPTGYKRGLHYGVTDEPPETRGLGITTAQALEFLDAALVDRTPWCCFVSLKEPHDPFVTGREAFERYDVESLELAPNTWDDMADKPGVYRKAQRVWADITSANGAKRPPATTPQLRRLTSSLVGCWKGWSGQVSSTTRSWL